MGERPTAPEVGDERASLLGSLERQRWIFAWKCSGVDASGLRARIASSTMTLGGLMKHLALIEDEYFTRRFSGGELGEPWASVDWEANPNWEWDSAADDSPEALLELWESAVARSKVVVRSTLATSGFDAPGCWTSGSSARPLLRRYVIDLIEEYARHLGHADILREAFDGLVGEEQPD